MKNLQDQMNENQPEPQFSVLWPLAKRSIKTQGAAAGLPDLSGKTVCELWDYIFRGDVMYAVIRERLTALYPGITRSVCSLIAAFVERNGAQGNTDRHKSMVLASSA